MRPKIITIIVSGGVIQDIQGIPKNVEVHVNDYDVEGVEPIKLSKDLAGNSYTKGVWKYEEILLS